MIFQVRSTAFTRSLGTCFKPKLLLCLPPVTTGHTLEAWDSKGERVFWSGLEGRQEGREGGREGGSGRGRGAAIHSPPSFTRPFEVRLCTVFPLLLKHGQLVQATVVEVEHLVLAFLTGDGTQLATGAGLIAERPSEGEGEQTHE